MCIYFCLKFAYIFYQYLSIGALLVGFDQNLVSIQYMLKFNTHPYSKSLF